MKNLYKILIVLCFHSCGNNVNELKELKRCQHSKLYGKSEICLPKVKGLIECSDNSQINQRLGFQVDKNNIILGFYLPDSSFKKVTKAKISQNEGLGFGYFKLWGHRDFVNKDLNNYQFGILSEQFNHSIRTEDSFIVQMQIFIATHPKMSLIGQPPKKNEINPFFNDPIQLEHYSILNNVQTIISILNNPVNPGQLVILTYNILKIESKVLFFSFYHQYIDESSITEAKKHNDNFGREILKSNGIKF